MIILYVRYEYSFDQFHKKADLIYQVVTKTYDNNSLEPIQTRSSEILATTLKNNFPEIAKAVRIKKTNRKLLVSYQNKKFYESHILYADPSFFKIFTFKFIEGNPSAALRYYDSVVITKGTARKYFGSSDPLGKTIIIGNKKDYTIRGVIQDVPNNSQIQFDFMVHFRARKSRLWYPYDVFTYVMLKKGIHIKPLPKLFTSYFKTNINSYPENTSIGLIPLTKIHLSNIPHEIGRGTDPIYVYLFSAIGLLILIIACVNYMNLATARFSDRAKELGVRKLIGANRYQLVFQILGETFLISLIALILSLFLVEFILPVFNYIARAKILSLKSLTSLPFISVLFGVLILTTIISGYYPAFHLTKYPLKHQFSRVFHFSNSQSVFRKSLVVFQFIIAISIILGSLIIEDQLIFIKNKSLGFHKNNILVINDNARALKSNYEAFKNNVMRYPDIKLVTSGEVPIVGKFINMPGLVKSNRKRQKPINLQVILVDYNYLKTIGIKILEGQPFLGTIYSNPHKKVIINQELVDQMGLKDPIGKKIKYLGEVVGVANNYNNYSLYQKIGPLAIMLNPGEHISLLVHFQAGHKNQVIQEVQKTWHEYVPNRPLLYSFLNNDLQNFYSSDQRLASIFLFFSILAILLACLGLFGLVAFSAEKRTKEIGIRKVNGASVWNIVQLLIKDFLILVGIGFFIAIPIAWYAMQRWLQNFAYHIHIGIGVFLLAGILAMVIALGTVSGQSIRAALMNPVESLRNE
jgi:putative ABC transport system permease protein